MASISVSLQTCSPGNVISLPCNGFQDGAASLSFAAQGGYKTVLVLVQGVIDENGTSGQQEFTFIVPDGLVSDTGVLVDAATPPNSASVTLRVEAQYVSSDEYLAAGEAGFDSGIVPLADGELDAIIRRASTYADQFMGEGVRYLQKLEKHKYQAPRNDTPPRLFPYRTKGRSSRCPILSLDRLTFVSAQNLVTTFNATDVYVNSDGGYLEILAYAVGNYALLGEIEAIGYSANVYEVLFTSGFTVATYPSAVREAVTMMTTSLLTRRLIQTMNMTGFLNTGGPMELDPKNPASGANFRMPIEAKHMLAPYCCFGAQ